ncbi:MAG: NAD-dependent epimerase/dehydratase family protein [Bacteroidota bacterium]
MLTTLVTGATGCVGSNLAIALNRTGYHVRILRRARSHIDALEGNPCTEFIGDICDESVLRAAMDGCDTVYHCAALVTFARGALDEQHRVNVLGTRAVVNACLSAGVKSLVHASSVTTIGHPAPGGCANEETPADRAAARGYKLSKILAEDEVRKGVERGLRAVIVNPSVVIGERDVRFHAGQLIRDIKRGLIFFYIDGGMNIVYVGDVVKGMIRASEVGRSGERYILAGHNMTHKEIFSRVAQLIDGRKPIGKLPLPLLRGIGHAIERTCRIIGVRPLFTADMAAVAGRYSWYSTAKAERELGFTKTGFDEAIVKAYQWYKAKGLL